MLLGVSENNGKFRNKSFLETLDHVHHFGIIYHVSCLMTSCLHSSPSMILYPSIPLHIKRGASSMAKDQEPLEKPPLTAYML